MWFSLWEGLLSSSCHGGGLDHFCYHGRSFISPQGKTEWGLSLMRWVKQCDWQFLPPLLLQQPDSSTSLHSHSCPRHLASASTEVDIGCGIGHGNSSLSVCGEPGDLLPWPCSFVSRSTSEKPPRSHVPSSLLHKQTGTMP